MPEAELIPPIKKTVGKQFNDGKPGPGRPPGVPNKLTTTVKQAGWHCLNKGTHRENQWQACHHMHGERSQG